MSNKANRADVIIIGAGLSGLMAALTLQKSEINFVILEAQPRVGGRVLTSTHFGNIIEYGAQFVSPHQTRIQNLLREYNLTTTSTYNEGTILYALNDKKKSSISDFPPFSLFSLFDYFWMQRLLRKLMKDIDARHPWESKNAQKLDTITMESWLENVMLSKSDKAFYRILSEQGLCVDLNQISLLDVLWDLKSIGSLKNVFTAEDEWITEGAGALPYRMASSLGEKVKLCEPVNRIEWTDSDVRVNSNRGEWLSRKVIMAMPPSSTNNIQYIPQLPSIRTEIGQKVGLGCSIKCVLIYDTPFWRKRGESGMTFYDKGPVRETIDTSPPDGRNGILTAFIIENDARRLGSLDDESRKKEILECLCYLFGPEALLPVAYYEKDWSSDNWARGGYGASLAPGVLTQLGEALIKPVGPIHWAGTETATEWRMYMEGALEAGERAALEVIDLLND